MNRPIVHTIPVEPRLNVVIEDSHNILIQLVDRDGNETARTGPLSNIDTLEQALHAARLWVRMKDNPPTLDQALAEWTRDRADCCGGTGGQHYRNCPVYGRG